MNVKPNPSASRPSKDASICLPRNFRGLKLASLNINSLPKHIDELRVFLAYNSVDVLSLCETKLDSSFNDSDVHVPGFEIIRRDRNRHGGGVCIYVNTSLNFSIRSDLSIQNLENLAVEIRYPHSAPVIVVNWYRPPNSSADIFTSLELLVGRLDSECVEFYLMGDMNCNMASPGDSVSRSLLDITRIYDLHQMINEATRITESTSTVIDLIFTNCPDRVICSGVTHIAISDHSLVYAYRKLSSNPVTKGHDTITYRSFKKFNRDDFRKDISLVDWNFLLCTDDPNTLWNSWKKKFLDVVEKHAPLRTKRVRSKKSPWITPDLKRRMHDRNKLKRKAIKTRDPNDWNAFKRARNSVNNLVKTSKERYYKNAFDYHKGNSRKTWQTINELTARKSKSSIVKELKIGEVTIDDPSEMSNTFNDYFAKIGPKLANDIPPLSDDASYLDYVKDSKNRFHFSPIDESQVLFFLNQLCLSKASGLDRISARIIRESADQISFAICKIFNCSLETGVFPDDWKFAKVTPLFKQGERNDINNYRPISVISVIAKVFERIIYDQLYSFLSVNHIISERQSGFRSLHSTLTALIEATDSWAYNIDRGNFNAVVFLDLKKAFDTVDHEILLTKLFAYGIQGVAYNWFESYLDNRKQQCFVNGSLSNTTTIKCGVPQGTILGPLLFILYINDLPNCLIHSQSRMYADDTSLSYADQDPNSVETCLNQDLDKISIWLSANKLTLNMKKTEFMLIGSRQKLNTLATTPVLKIDQAPVKQVSTTKSLGVVLDDRLTWHDQIEHLCKKIASGIGALKRIRQFVPPSTLHLIFKTLVQPHFDYCDIVWGSCGETLSTKLQKLQNRAARVLTFSSYDTDANQLISDLGWNTLSTQRDKHKAILVFKSLNGLTPEYLGSRFISREDTNPYSLRDSMNKLAIPLPRTNYYKNSFAYSGAVLWNSLPSEVRQTGSLREFRNVLNKHYS